MAKRRISAILAGYAKLRNWPTNESQRKAITKAIKEVTSDHPSNNKAEVSSLLKERKYVVLQGAPGTGKTRLAKNIAEENGQLKPSSHNFMQKRLTLILFMAYVQN